MPAASGFSPIRSCFLLFIFSLAFEHVTLLWGVNIFTISKGIGYLLALMALLKPTVYFASPPRVFWLFFAYWCVYALRALIRLDFSNDTIGSTFTLFQCVVLFWLSYNMFRFPGMLKATYGALAWSLFVLAALAYLGIITTEYVYYRFDLRQTVLWLNPNELAFLYGVGSLCALAIGGDRTVAFYWRCIMFGVAALLLVPAVETGSRGAMLSFAAGIVALALASTGLTGKIKGIIIVGVIGLTFGYIILSTEVAKYRWSETLIEGKTAGRERIFKNSLEMFLERPLIGWGPTTHLAELANREFFKGEVRDTHNDVLWTLTATGLLGGVFFISGLGYCYWQAWKARRGPLGPFPFALITALLIISMAGTLQKRKIFWVITAIAVSGASLTAENSLKPSRRLVSSPISKFAP